MLSEEQNAQEVILHCLSSASALFSVKVWTGTFNFQKQEKNKATPLLTG